MREWKITLAALIILTCCFITACPETETGDIQDNETPVIQPEESDDPALNSDFRLAETLTKRVVLYKVAAQEGNLAPFTAHPDTLEGLDISPNGMRFNRIWWGIDFDDISIAPLGAQTMTELEPVIFPYIAVRIDDAADDGSWVLLTAGYDSIGIRFPIADAHTEWIAERREIYLTRQEPECVQVWCVQINGEWKILGHVDCPSAIDPPDSPGRPERVTPPVEEEEVSEEGK